MTKITRNIFQDMQKITMENNSISLSVLPEVGGKIISLVLKKTNQEFISLSGRKFRKPTYAANYEEYDISGFDECFPAIAEGFYPEWPWKGTVIPDHGEIFTLPWDCKIEKDKLIMTVYGIRFPYKFTKIISLEKNTVKINYELNNSSPYDFKYIWSAHPLFAVTEGTKILLSGNPNLRTDFSKNERFGKHLYETSWPNAMQANGKTVDISIIRNATANAATKFFTTKLEKGFCALEYPQGSSLTMTFDTEKVPYVGLWINEGGWPFEGKKSFNVALEPCTGCPDKLENAIQRNECSTIRGQGTNYWHLNISLGTIE